MKKPDSLIFDMDGTLWDALDVYVDSWNTAFKKLDIDKHLQRSDISFMMGWEGRKVLDAVLPGYSLEEQDEVYKAVNTIRGRLIGENGGIIYGGVNEGLEKLAGRYKLFIVSNCPKGIVDLFMVRAGISHLITGHMEYGVNSMPKHHNIKLIIEKYQLKDPVYIGDTDGDAEQSALAGVPFVFLSFGFGKTENYALKFDDFRSFTDYFMELQ